MIKHVLKIIWNQRRANGWIFAELLVVVAILFSMMDSLLVDFYAYHQPLGFDITNTYKVQLGVLKPGMMGYVDEITLATGLGEDAMRLVDNLRQAPEVEEASISCVGSPYTYSNMWSSLVPDGVDSTWEVHSFQHHIVDAEYFDVLRMTTDDGNPITPLIRPEVGYVLSRELAGKLFEGKRAIGEYVKFNMNNTDRYPVFAVSTPVRRSEYEKANARFFEVATPARMIDLIAQWQVMPMDILVRMRSNLTPDEFEAFLQGMGERLTVNNVYVSGGYSMKEMRADILKSREDNMKKKSALVGFMLLNVFFGIIGTFWLRTQARQGEMGLRIAIGSSRSQLRRLMSIEGLCLLALTVPLILIYLGNILYLDLPDTYRLPYTWWRFAATFGGAYLLMAGMISLGIWLPVRKAMQMEPVEALHYE